MAGAGSIVALIAVFGAFFYWRGWLERWRWFLWLGVAGAILPFIATTAGWVLTEVGRQPWIVQGLLKTANANSPAVSTTWIWTSISVFVALYAVLFVVDVYLMRHFAGREPSVPSEEELEMPVPAF